MKTLASLAAAAVTALAASGAMAQAPAAAPKAAKPVVKTTCADYMGLDETIKPQFIYYAVGHGKHGKPEAVFDETAIATIKPEVDKFCAVNLNKSAYDHVMASSMASERAARGAKK